MIDESKKQDLLLQLENMSNALDQAFNADWEFRDMLKSVHGKELANRLEKIGVHLAHLDFAFNSFRTYLRENGYL